MGFKAWFLKRKLNKALEPYDTDLERRKIMEIQVKNGLPPWLANIGIMAWAALVTVLQASDVSLALSDPKTYGKWFVVAVITRIIANLPAPGTSNVQKVDTNTGKIISTEVVPTKDLK